MNAEQIRNEYRRLRRLSGLTNAAFDSRARGYATEDGEGEEPTPADWLKGASEVVYMVTCGRNGAKYAALVGK